MHSKPHKWSHRKFSSLLSLILLDKTYKNACCKCSPLKPCSRWHNFPNVTVQLNDLPGYITLNTIVMNSGSNHHAHNTNVRHFFTCKSWRNAENHQIWWNDMHFYCHLTSARSLTHKIIFFASFTIFFLYILRWLWCSLFCMWHVWRVTRLN